MAAATPRIPISPTITATYELGDTDIGNGVEIADIVRSRAEESPSFTFVFEKSPNVTYTATFTNKQSDPVTLNKLKWHEGISPLSKKNLSDYQSNLNTLFKTTHRVSKIINSYLQIDAPDYHASKLTHIRHLNKVLGTRDALKAAKYADSFKLAPVDKINATNLLRYVTQNSLIVFQYENGLIDCSSSDPDEHSRAVSGYDALRSELAKIKGNSKATLALISQLPLIDTKETLSAAGINPELFSYISAYEESDISQNLDLSFENLLVQSKKNETQEVIFLGCSDSAHRAALTVSLAHNLKFTGLMYVKNAARILQPIVDEKDENNETKPIDKSDFSMLFKVIERECPNNEHVKKLQNKLSSVTS